MDPSSHVVPAEPREATWKDSTGRSRRALTWLPGGSPVAAVALVHGHGEHAGRYGPLAAHLIPHGFAVTGVDHPGHGRSAGKRGHIESLGGYLESVDLLLAEAARIAPGRPVFLWGHSMGGSIALNHLLYRRPDVAGAVITSPWLRLAFQPPAVKVLLARIMNRLYPAWSDRTGLDASAISRDEQVVRDYESDPLVHDRTTARAFLTMHMAGLDALRRAGEIETPILLMHGTADRLTDWHASEEFADRSGENVFWTPWEAGYHELHHEPMRGEVLDEAVRWMRRTVGDPG